MKKITFLFTLVLNTVLMSAQDNVSGIFGTTNLEQQLYIEEANDDATGSTFRISGNHTFEMWVNIPDAERGYLMFFGRSNSYTGAFRIEAVGDGTVQVAFTDVDGDNIFSVVSTSFLDGNWHHIAYTGSTIGTTTTSHLYIDGAEDASTIGDISTYTRPDAALWINTTGADPSNVGNSRRFCIGGRASTTAGPPSTDPNVVITGEMDEVRTWTVTRTPTQIADESCSIVDATGLHRHFKFNNDEVDSANAVIIVSYTDLTYGTANCATASTKDNVLGAAIKLYPNPARTIVTIEKQANVSLKSVALYSILGNEVYKSTNTKSINISSFSKGLYLLKIESNEGAVATKKLIVE